MDKLTMAHEFYIANKDNYIGTSFSDIAKQCFGYVDAMQAEADKRKEKGMPDALLTKDENGNCTHFHTTLDMGECFDCGKVLNMADSTQLEWQPDWSVAPTHMNYFFMDRNGSKFWTVNEPDKPNSTEHVVNFTDCGGDCYAYASDQDYKGDWRNSLRKRPEMEAERHG